MVGAKKKRRVHRPRVSPTGPLLSVCMIVRDEESNLDRCLRSVRQIADEIIVVDTGSQDRTVEIARRFGAKVSHFEWCDDFAAARNAALAQATGQWILQMDADEELTADTIGRVRGTLNCADPKCWGFFVIVRSELLRQGQRHQTFGRRLLLFRNHPYMRYHNRIHEQIRYGGPEPLPEYRDDGRLAINHYGYLPDQMEAKAKAQRNIRLLQIATAEDPDNPFHQYNLGLQYYLQGRFGDAIAPLRRSAFLCRGPIPSYQISVYTLLIVALARVGREKEVLETIHEAESRLPRLTSDFHCNTGEALRTIGYPDLALVHFQQAIGSGEAELGIESDPATRTWLPKLGIGMIHEARGDLNRARACYEEALGYVPDNPELHWRMAATAAALGMPESAMQHIERAGQVDVLPEHVAGGLLQVCLQLPDQATQNASGLSGFRGVATQLVARIRPRAAVGVQLAEVCYRLGDFARGIEAANAVLTEREDALARVNRAMCYFALGRYQEAAADFDVAETLKRRSEGDRSGNGIKASGGSANADKAPERAPSGQAGSISHVPESSIEYADLQAAYDSLSGLVDRHPADLTLRFRLCDLLSAVGEWGEALRVMEDGWEHGSTDPYYHERLAVVLRKLGREEDAALADRLATVLRNRGQAREEPRVGPASPV